MNVSIISNPIKVVLISGTFKLEPTDNELGFSKTVDLQTRIALDYLDIRMGTWNVSLKDICFTSASAIDEVTLFCSVSTNLVDGKFINKNNCLELFYPPLERFKFKLGLTIFKSPTWLTINSATPLTELYINFFPEIKKPNPPTRISNLNCEVTVTLLFQRLQ